MFNGQTERKPISPGIFDLQPTRIAVSPGHKTQPVIGVESYGRCAVYDAKTNLADRHMHNAREVDVRELQHRMKNMMAVIESLCRQTMRQSETKEEFEKQFMARLSAYSKSIDLLIADNWQGLDIDDLVRSQLATFGIIDGCQIAAAGPRMRLSAHAAHSIGLAIHELATNAAKYGALSVPQGRVCISWSVLETDLGDRFSLRWQEAGGPVVTPPTRRGFGYRIIQSLSSSAISGRTSYDFLPEGVRWAIDAPASSALVAL